MVETLSKRERVFERLQRLGVAAPFGKLFVAVSDGVACVDVSAVEAVDEAADAATRKQVATLESASKVINNFHASWEKHL